MMIYARCILFLITIHILSGDLTSYIDLHDGGTDFIPANPIELFGIHSLISSAYDCSLLCHQDPQCRTFVFDSSACQLYESSSDTGSIITSNSTSRIFGEIIYDKINVSSAYNQSCSHCYPDRYLVCINTTCQCPRNTFYDDQSKCINQLYLDSILTCQINSWCRQDLNLTCQCGKCQCPFETYWDNTTCKSQLLAGAHYNSSDQCRNDLNLTCSRKNKTCTPMSLVKIPVINGTLPSKFSYVGMIFNYSGYEWWRAFDNDVTTYWNRLGTYNVLDYILITFNDTYLLNSLQLTVVGDVTHDPKIIDVYMDENGTCFGQSFSFSLIGNGTLTFTRSPFENITKSLATKQVLLSIERWSTFQTYLAELTFFGSLY